MHKPKHGKTFRPGPQPVPMGKAGEDEALFGIAAGVEDVLRSAMGR